MKRADLKPGEHYYVQRGQWGIARRMLIIAPPATVIASPHSTTEIDTPLGKAYGGFILRERRPLGPYVIGVELSDDGTVKPGAMIRAMVVSLRSIRGPWEQEKRAADDALVALRTRQEEQQEEVQRRRDEDDEFERRMKALGIEHARVMPGGWSSRDVSVHRSALRALLDLAESRADE